MFPVQCLLERALHASHPDVPDSLRLPAVALAKEEIAKVDQPNLVRLVNATLVAGNGDLAAAFVERLTDLNLFGIETPHEHNGLGGQTITNSWGSNEPSIHGADLYRVARGTTTNSGFSLMKDTNGFGVSTSKSTQQLMACIALDDTLEWDHMPKADYAFVIARWRMENCHLRGKSRAAIDARLTLDPKYWYDAFHMQRNPLMLPLLAAKAGENILIQSLLQYPLSHLKPLGIKAKPIFSSAHVAYRLLENLPSADTFYDQPIEAQRDQIRDLLEPFCPVDDTKPRYPKGTDYANTPEAIAKRAAKAAKRAALAQTPPV